MIINMTGGGGGSGGTLVVTAPVGVTVTATKGNKTYARVVNAEGKATFRGLSTGTWMLSIDDATHEPSTPVPVEIRADYTVTLNFFSATINVTYPAGSTCTCTDGTITLTATTTTGNYTFTVPNAGTWTVSSTNGSQTDSEAVSITTDGQSESVTLTYFSATINITYPAMSNCVVTDGDGVTVASDSNTEGDAKTWTATVTAADAYTVTATAIDGSGKSKRQSVEITSEGQSESVELEYILYLFNNGTVNDITWTKLTGSEFAVSNVIIVRAAPGQETYGTTNNKIDLSSYKKISMNVIQIGDVDGRSQLYVSTDKNASMIASVGATGTGIFSLDISELSSAYYVGLYTRYNGSFTVDKIWAE